MTLDGVRDSGEAGGAGDGAGGAGDELLLFGAWCHELATASNEGIVGAAEAIDDDDDDDEGGAVGASLTGLGVDETSPEEDMVKEPLKMELSAWAAHSARCAGMSRRGAEKVPQLEHVMTALSTRSSANHEPRICMRCEVGELLADSLDVSASPLQDSSSCAASARNTLTVASPEVSLLAHTSK